MMMDKQIRPASTKSCNRDLIFPVFCSRDTHVQETKDCTIDHELNDLAYFSLGVYIPGNNPDGFANSE